MPAYLLKPEILDLMWTTGAQISEVLALTPSHFIDDGYDFMVALCTLKQRPERSTNTQLARSIKRAIPIVAPMLIDLVQSYLYAGNFRRDERVFTMERQTVNRHIHNLVERVGCAPINITCHTFRHNFAMHLLLHGRPLQIVSQLLGHKSIESTEICTNVLTADGGHFLDEVDFHR